MKYNVLAVTRKEIENGENKGEFYYTVEAKDPDPMVTRSILFPVFPTTESVHAWWEETATKFEAGDNSRLKTINVGAFTVGDTDRNPAAKPLPAFRLKNSRTGDWGAVSTMMKVHVLLDSDGEPRVAPRAEALRIIKRIGEFVDSHVAAEPQVESTDVPI